MISSRLFASLILDESLFAEFGEAALHRAPHPKPSNGDGKEEILQCHRPTHICATAIGNRMLHQHVQNLRFQRLGLFVGDCAGCGDGVRGGAGAGGGGNVECGMQNKDEIIRADTSDTRRLFISTYHADLHG